MERRHISFYDQIARNKRKSLLLALGVFILITSLIYLIGLAIAPEYSTALLFLGIVFSSIHVLATYNYGDKLVLSAVKAKPADPRRHVYLINTVEGLSIAAGIPPPKVYILDWDDINAFATGKDPKHASIAVTRGALEKLNRMELEGVVGHEIAHIANYDIRFMTVVAAMVGLTAIISDMFLRSVRYTPRRKDEEKGKGGLILLVALILAVVSPIIARIVQAAISREREFLADATSAKLTRYPEGLASALEKIMKFNKAKNRVSEAVSHLFISDPNKSPLDKLFATHPPIEERIKILRSM